MSGAVANFETCLACLRGRGVTHFTGPSECPEDGKPVREHAKAGACPLNLLSPVLVEDASAPPAASKRCGCGQRIARGVVGLAKAALGVDKADDAEIERRLSLCLACEHVKATLGVVNRCDLCGCAIKAKIRIKGEACPANPPRW